MQSGERFWKSGVVTTFLILTPFLCNGCANPGPPKPPSLYLPQLVNDLSAERVGDHVLLRWTTPSRTTDEMEINGAMSAEVCRDADARPASAHAKLATCTPVRRVQVTSGRSEMTDTLPVALLVDPVMLLSYRIQIFNSSGHSGGESVGAAFAASGQAPAPIAALQAKASERGAVLEWHRAVSAEGDSAQWIDLDRVDLSARAPAENKLRPPVVPATAKGKTAKPKKSDQEPPNEIHLRAPNTVSALNADMAGTVDSTAATGRTYTYSVHRVRTVRPGNHDLEIQSEPSSRLTLAMADTFPPKIPNGLASISGTTSAGAGSEPAPYIDLSWEPNGEADLAGYRVYRQLARPDGSPQGPLARLTHTVITVSTYRDVAVRAGQGYIYTVTAVDAAGNESAPSARALEALPSDSGQPPK